MARICAEAGGHERGGEEGESEPAGHLFFRFWFRGETEINAAIVVLLRGRSQVELVEWDFVMAPRRQVVQRVSNHCVILNFKLMTVFEDKQGLGQVRDRGLRRRGGWSCFSFRLGTGGPCG